MAEVIAAATGRRKTAVARVQLVAEPGVCEINHRPADEYFPSEAIRVYMMQPLKLVDSEGRYGIRAFVKGSGFTGQSGAIRLALARALIIADANSREVLKGEGCLTRDSRMKERKKPGQRGARRRFQFSKR